MNALLEATLAVLLVAIPLALVRPRAGAAANPVGDPLFDALRACRRALAEEAGVPPYVIFHDSTLREMAEQQPQSIRELGTISGIGQKKLDAYGDAFLAALRTSL